MEWSNPSRHGFPRQNVPQSVALSKKRRLKHSLVQKTALVSFANLSFKLGQHLNSQGRSHEKIIAGDYDAFALASGANAVVVNAITSVGDSGTTTLQGFADVGTPPTTAVSVTGLTADRFLKFDGVTNSGLTWNFDYTITNTSSGHVRDLAAFGFATDPTAISGTSHRNVRHCDDQSSIPEHPASGTDHRHLLRSRQRVSSGVRLGNGQ